MFSSTNKSAVDKDQFLESARAARKGRELDRCQHSSAIILQSAIRGFLARKNLYKRLSDQIQAKLDTYPTQKPTSVELFQIGKTILYLLRQEFQHDYRGQSKKFRDKYASIDQFLLEKHHTNIYSSTICKQFEKYCKQIVLSMFSTDPENSFVGISINTPKHNEEFVDQCKKICLFACHYLRHLSSDQSNHSGVIQVYLNILVSLTSIVSWQVIKSSKDPDLKKNLDKNCLMILEYLINGDALFYQTLGLLLVNGLSRSKATLNKLSLVAIFTLSIRINQYKSEHSKELILFIKHILSVPALLYHLNKTASETIQILCLKESFILKAIQELINSNTYFDDICKFLRGTYTLCLVGNIINFVFFALQTDDFFDKIGEGFIVNFACLLCRMINFMQNYVLSKQSSLTNWHPILGWFSQTLDRNIHESMDLVKNQLQFLWNPQMIQFMFEPLFQATSVLNKQSSSRKNSSALQNATNVEQQSSLKSNWKNSFIAKALEKAQNLTSGKMSFSTGLSGTSWEPVYTLDQIELMNVSTVTWMYQTAINTFTQMKHDIFSGLSYKEILLPDLWKLITVLGPQNPCHAFLTELDSNFKPSAKEFSILILFCECATHLITILDDIELYENQKPFTLDDLVMISHFLNNFVYRLIQSDFMSISLGENPLLNSTHSLLMCLYKRDSRRPFTPKDHWLIRELKISAFMKELEQNKEPAKSILAKIPHVIPHKERVILFRKLIAADKEHISVQAVNDMVVLSTLITINRSHLVEDGYHQLNSLPPLALKGLIRVKFINEQGLDEAGIDQDGVFKEFLEDTIKKVFDPSLNLFKVTSEQRLYPSPTSYMQDDHLSLFEFVGKMIGKAIYEGIVVDVPFASFFLSQVLGQQQSSLYSSIDELPSLDPELYKSLTYLKHYEDVDISQLGLTFSVDEDCLGQIVTHELLHGGRAIPVTKETRISYIHLMAHFRMHTQIHEQTAAFIRGFRSIIKSDFLFMFSTPEFQRIISGDNSPIDIEDLKKHTKYFGGFHSQHRVIGWLWDILEKDFTPEEHRLFLKFTTSCSKPPLLGFAHLEPPFSIRCVEVGEDQDTGDTVGSVLRGFFTIRRKDPVNRLPTSSTCFNLLKLPNYQKKSTLKEKLRYAINSNTGFELS